MKLTSALPLLFAVALPMSAQTLIFDDFNSADNTDLNADLSRQSGTLAPLSWNEIGGPGNLSQILNNQLNTGGSSSSFDYSAELDYNFGGNAALVAGGQFSIAFDLITLASGSYTSFAIAGDPNRPRPAVDASTEFALLFRESADDISIREGTGSAGTVLSPAALTGAVIMTVTTDSISNGENFTIGMTIAGNVIDLNGGDAGTDFSGVWDSSDMYLSVGSRNGSSVIDNFSVTAIPEPSSIALVFGGLTLAWAIRRRKMAA